MQYIAQDISVNQLCFVIGKRLLGTGNKHLERNAWTQL